MNAQVIFELAGSYRLVRTMPAKDVPQMAVDLAAKWSEPVTVIVRIDREPNVEERPVFGVAPSGRRARLDSAADTMFPGWHGELEQESRPAAAVKIELPPAGTSQRRAIEAQRLQDGLKEAADMAEAYRDAIAARLREATGGKGVRDAIHILMAAAPADSRGQAALRDGGRLVGAAMWFEGVGRAYLAEITCEVTPEITCRSTSEITCSATPLSPTATTGNKTESEHG